MDLSAFCNADASILGGQQTIPTGAQTYRGLPFLIGRSDGAGQSVIAFGTGHREEPLRIPISAQVRHVLFAHRLLDSKIREGGPIGKPCADYLFEYEDGEKLTASIRDRFEIAVLPVVWGQLPFLAYPDHDDQLLPRYQGEWDSAGQHQTEVGQQWPVFFHLWPWQNPHPEKPIASILIRPHGPRFYIGAITLGHRDEPPFRRSAKREVKIVLLQPTDAGQPFGLEVTVDRGVATYPHPLPQESAAEFLTHPNKGFGELRNPNASPAYTEISAIPSATVTVKQKGETLGSVAWGDIESKGQAGTSRVSLELVDSGRNWVHTTVLDDETGKPVPCRIHFRSTHGIPYQPHGHHNHVNSNLNTWHIDVGGDVRLGQITYAYIDGKCQGWLPRGEVLVEIARGFEYEPIRAKVALQPGQRELTFRLKRMCDMSRERYFSGDTHVHFLSTQGAHLEAAGEDLNVVNLLLSQWGHLFTNTEEFTGRPSMAPDGKTIVYATQENRQHILGHLTLLGLKEPVMPWCSDGPGEAELGGNLETTLCHWADACHAQGGTVVIPHMPDPNCEPAALIVTGRADAAEWIRQTPYSHLEYYRYLNCGYRLPLAGGTDKMSSEVPVGLYRTYVCIPEDQPFTYDTWCKALRAGNTFQSGGPLLRFRVEGQPIGSTIRLPGNGGTVTVEVSAQSVLPFHSLEIVLSGEVVARVEESKGAHQLRLREKIKVERHSWIAARCGGAGYHGNLLHHDAWQRAIMAHTSPVYLAVGGEWTMFNPDTANYLLTLLHGGIDYVRHRSLQWKKESVTHHHGRHDHQAFLEEPFHQAIDALHQRMHALNIPH